MAADEVGDADELGDADEFGDANKVVDADKVGDENVVVIEITIGDVGKRRMDGDDDDEPCAMKKRKM